jgi:hypothetical protein
MNSFFSLFVKTSFSLSQ